MQEKRNREDQSRAGLRKGRRREDKMESGVGNHYGSGKSGGGNGGLFCDTCELGAPWGAPHHGPPHQLPSPFFHLNNPAAHSIPFSSATSLPFSPHHHNLHTIAQAGDAHHLTCLKLGKRQYYEEGRASDPPAASGGLKRERVATAVPRGSSSAAAAATASPPSSSSAMVVPRCQVEGCNLALVDAKDYHRRHKVCEIHSKAPKVVVLGIEQRFCQQCSRYLSPHWPSQTVYLGRLDQYFILLIFLQMS